MSFQEIVKVICDNGTGVILLGYFLFKDYKFYDRTTLAIETMGNALVLLINKLGLEEDVNYDIHSSKG